jgi:hypothetical protein
MVRSKRRLLEVVRSEHNISSKHLQANDINKTATKSVLFIGRILSAQRPYIQENQLSKYLHLKPLKNTLFSILIHISLDLNFPKS